MEGWLGAKRKPQADDCPDRVVFASDGRDRSVRDHGNPTPRRSEAGASRTARRSARGEGPRCIRAARASRPDGASFVGPRAVRGCDGPDGTLVAPGSGGTSRSPPVPPPLPAPRGVHHGGPPRSVTATTALTALGATRVHHGPPWAGRGRSAPAMPCTMKSPPRAAPGRPGPSHAPPPPCAGGIVAGPGAPDMRNRGSRAAPAGRQDGGDPSNRGRAVTRSQRGCPCRAGPGETRPVV